VLKVGSYPYFKPGSFGTSIVLRSENISQLNKATEAVLSAVIKLGGKGKIFEEGQVDKRDL